MTATVASFRTSFREFQSAAAYPDPDIQFWLDLCQGVAPAPGLLNVDRWLSLRDMGAMLFTAHNVVLEKRAQAEAQNGAVPGSNTGPISNKSVDKVSIAYDTASASDEKAGHWNLTTYGTRYTYMMRLVGAGPVQLNTGFYPLGPLSSVNGWSGPYTAPGWFGS